MRTLKALDMKTENDRAEGRRLAETVMDRFLAAPSLDDLVPEVATSREILASSGVANLAASFFENLSSVLRTVGIPVALASSAVHGSHLQRFHTAERIRSRNLVQGEGETEADLEARRAAASWDVAIQRMDEFCKSEDGRGHMADDACRFLESALEDAEVDAAVTELLLQGEILAWSALEGLARDLFEFLVNADPENVRSLLADPMARQRIPPKISLEELAIAGFNLSSSIGTFLAAHQDFSDVRSIRALIPPILGGGSDLSSVLNEPGLWKLSQRRHLIVHRRGIVDTKYLENTGDKAVIGVRIYLSPADLERDLRSVALAGLAMLIQAHAVVSKETTSSPKK
ncbi:MAG: hypothetical protein ACRD16_05905 [Thermoanaerobaculia bacterium]